jgi:CBS domain-containing protein
MKVKDVMTADVKTCLVNSDLSTVAQAMWMRDCGVLPIVNAEGQVVGVVTDRDISIAAGCRNCPPAGVPVTDVMTRKVHSCEPDANIRDALQIMREHRVRRLPVINAKEELCGILSLNDVAIKVREIANPTELSAEDVETTLEAICKHHPATEHEAAA